jgi:DNA-binding transcriptional MerR regulator
MVSLLSMAAWLLGRQPQDKADVRTVRCGSLISTWTARSRHVVATPGPVLMASSRRQLKAVEDKSAPVLDLHPRAGFMLRHVDELMPIGEFSERSGLSPKRLRSYAAGGLLVPAAVDSVSGYRYYSPGQLREAQLIDALREAGMPLADIRALLRDPSGEQLDAWARRVEIDAAQRHKALDLARRMLAIETTSFPGIDDERPRKESTMMKLRTVSRTDIGRVRDNNEDAVVSSDRLAAVADGMGGHPGGEVASAVAIGLMQAAFTGRSLDELQAAVRAANRAIWDRADGSTEWRAWERRSVRLA